MNSQNSKQKPENPLQNASRLSRMTFWWLKDLYKIGMTRPITDDDVYQTIDHHECDRIANKFKTLWQKELDGSKRPSALRLIYNAYGPPVLIIGLLFSVCETLMRCAQPLLLGELLTYFADESASKEWAYIYAAGIVICSIVPVITFHPFIYYIFEIGMKIRIGCSRLVYDKILRITKSVQEDGMHGKVINLLSNDFSKFDIALAFLHDLWKGPFETILLGFLIYREVGISGVFGILFILSFIPIQSYIGKKAAHFRNQTTKRTDIRVRLMNEIINGIQVIKMYSWQQNFAKVIEKVRRKEIAAVKGSSYILALLYTLWAVSRVSLFLTLITFVYSGNVLTARKVVNSFYRHSIL
ncbi:hypothetical protein PVAND_002633 [Polypedilum vanderplanki]|uniref:ABC transmembrane type-1 domain-containing protein n=1 Tax=Polypedilum vanderplanki TaxID=319348 RepID=A0A9J6BSB0_POLVA|nr:hypothetical protein PVAND_002633 [Polypedilum vanderplanki]